MRFAILFLMVSGLTLSACSGMRDSRANPANWFGGSKVERRAAPVAAETFNPLIPEQRESIFRRKSEEAAYDGTLLYAVEDVSVERSAGGAIIKATGLSLRQGAFDVRLVPENKGEPVDGVLTYAMRALQRTDTPQGPDQTRRVRAGVFITSQMLAKVRAVQVLGQTNTATTRR
ncbi:hypothetical protein OO012_04020 [Rhodobacteraceae bacterium KMM 6894]|nr:hypothetical protein [Rhodobacteraceae bacterium KMM 6894]